jgi:hypothetical protein
MSSGEAIRGRGAPPVAGRGRGRSASAGAGRGRGRGAARGRGRGRGRGISPTASPARAAYVAPVYASPTANLIQQNNRGLLSLAAGAVQRTTGFDVSESAEQYADAATEGVVVTASAVGEFLNSPPGQTLLAVGVGAGLFTLGVSRTTGSTIAGMIGLYAASGVASAITNRALENSMVGIASTAVQQFMSRRQPPP